MITSKTATVVTVVTTLIWMFSIIYGMISPYHSESVNGIFMVIVGAALAMSSVSGRAAASATEEESEYVIRHLQRSKFMNWVLKTFFRSYWRDEIEMDIAWYDHKDDTPHHVVIGPEECPFCIQAAEREREAAVGRASNITPLMINNYSGFNNTTGVTVDSSGNMTIKDPPKPEEPQMSPAELWKFKQYVASVPFMSWEEGEEIVTKNMTGEVMVSYKTPDILRCEVCPDRRPHYHDDIKIARTPEFKAGYVSESGDKPVIDLEIPEYDLITR